MNPIKLKVCGMKNSQNILDLVLLNPYMMGFIFVKDSLRYYDADSIPKIDENIKKIGVFKNQTYNEIKKCIDKFGLDGVQLHGEETTNFCALFKNSIVLKAFAPRPNFDWNVLDEYKDCTDYFLFDNSKNGISGGTGEKFEWNLLEKYKTNHPFFLSGGIKPKDVQNILEIDHSELAGVDINSGFELEPGIKNIKKIAQFSQRLELG